MKCPTCGTWTDVSQSRPSADNSFVRRTRRCANDHTFVTFETTLPEMLPLHEAESARERGWVQTVERVYAMRQDGRSCADIREALGICAATYARAVRDAR